MTEYTEEEFARRTKLIEDITKNLEQLGIDVVDDGEPVLKVIK